MSRTMTVAPETETDDLPDAPRASAVVAAALNATRARQSDIRRRLTALEADVERTRTAIGRAVARGDETASQYAALQPLENEADGLRRALPVLSEDAEALMAELAAARAADVEERCADAEEAARAAFTEADAAFRLWLAGPMAALASRMQVTITALDAAERALQDATRPAGSTPLGRPRTAAATWHAHPGLREALLVSRAYAADDVIRVDAWNRLQQPIVDPFAANPRSQNL